jgi:hypothetical protein
VLGARVDPTQGYQTVNTLMRCSVELERIGGGFARPGIETVVVGVTRTNNSITSGSPQSFMGWHVGDQNAYGGDVGFAWSVSRTSEDGVIYGALKDVPEGTEVWDSPTSAANFYHSTATIEYQSSGTWYPVVGRQMPDSLAGNWRMTNGLIRLSPSSTNVGDLKVELYDGTTWQAAATELRYGNDSSGTFQDVGSSAIGGFFTGYDKENSTTEWVEPHVIRNSRDTVILGFTRAKGYYQTLKLHAFDFVAEFYTSASSSTVHAIQSRSTWAAQQVGTDGENISSNPGVYSSSDDGNGDRLMILQTDVAFTEYPAPAEGLYINAGTTAVAFGIGVILDGGSAFLENNEDYVAEQYLGAKSWHTVVTGR